MSIKKFNEFKINENAGEPKEVARGNYDDTNIIIFLISNSPFDNFFYAEDEEGDDWGDVSTKLPGNDLTDAIWVKEGEHEEAFAGILVSNNILTRTELTTGGGMNTYRKYDII